MPDFDEISLTEKQLDTNRTKAEGEKLDSAYARKGRIDPAETPRPVRSTPAPPGVKTVVGVAFGDRMIKLATATQDPRGRPSFLEYDVVPVNRVTDFDHPEWPGVLRNTLNRFAGSPGALEVWCTLGSANIDIRTFRIPQLPQKEIFNSVYWKFKKESRPFGGDVLFNYTTLGEVVEDGWSKWEVLAYMVPTQEVQTLKTLFDRAGFPLTGITLEPFALQNFLKTSGILPDRSFLLMLCCDDQYFRLDAFVEGDLFLSKTFRPGLAGADAITRMDDPTFAAMEHEDTISDHPGSGRPAGGPFNESGLTAEDKTLPPPVNENAPEKDARALNPVLPALIETIRTTYEQLTRRPGSAPAGDLIVHGKASPDHPVMTALEQSVGLPLKWIDLQAQVNPIRNRSTVQPQVVRAATFLETVGLALSNPQVTPNFIASGGEARRPEPTRLGRAMKYTSLLLLVVVLVLGYIWPYQIIERKKSRLDDLQRQLEQYSPQVDQDLVRRLLSEGNTKMDHLARYSQKHLGLAVFNELSLLTPSSIHLFEISINMGSAEPGAVRVDKTLELQGFVMGDQAKLESILTEYLLRLDHSPLFTRPVVRSQTRQEHEGAEVLKFEVALWLA